MTRSKRELDVTVIEVLFRVKLALVLALACAMMTRVVAHSRSADYLLSEVRKQPDTSIVRYTKRVVSVISCTFTCSERKSKSLYFVEDSKTCHCNHGLEDSTEVDGLGLITYGVLKTIGQPCSSDEDCTAASSGCPIFTCRCDLPLRYNPGNNSCVRTCERYGSTFQKYRMQRTIIQDSSNSIDIGEVSEEECLNSCLQSQQPCYSMSDLSFVVATPCTLYLTTSITLEYGLDVQESSLRDCA